jgi:hypothetical protein
VTGRAFWSLVTVAGTLTVVHIAASASANNYSVLAVVYEGPFVASPLDANPANTTDATSPYNAPATGVLAQAVEQVISWICYAGGTVVNATGGLTTSGNVLDAGSLASVTVGDVTVASTASVSPVFTGTSFTATQGTNSFKGVSNPFVTETAPPTYFEPPEWQGSAKASEALKLLTAQSFFGAGGQVPQAQFIFTPDDSPNWNFPFQPILELSAFPVTTTPLTNFYIHWYDEASSWPAAPTRSRVLQLLSAAGKVPPSTWDYWNNDPAVWQGAPTNSLILPILETGQVKPFRWNYTLNDPAVWSGSPLRSVSLSALSTSQVPSFTWNYGIDDATTWLEPQRRNDILFQPTTGFPRAPFWAPRPPDITVTPRVIQPFIGTFFPPALTTPFNNRQTYWYAEPPVWTGSPRAATNLQISSVVFMPRAPFWAPRPADPPVWWSAATERVTSLYAPLVPFSNRQTWWYSEDAWWTGSSTPADTLSILSNAGIVKARFWRWDFDVAASNWQSTIREDLILLTTVVGKPLALYRLFTDMGYYDDAAVWSGSPLTAWAPILPPPPKVPAVYANPFFAAMGTLGGIAGNPPS